jgi:hypothetical protein
MQRWGQIQDWILWFYPQQSTLQCRPNRCYSWPSYFYIFLCRLEQLNTTVVWTRSPSLMCRKPQSKKNYSSASPMMCFLEPHSHEQVLSSFDSYARFKGALASRAWRMTRASAYESCVKHDPSRRLRVVRHTINSVTSCTSHHLQISLGRLPVNSVKVRSSDSDNHNCRIMNMNTKPVPPILRCPLMAGVPRRTYIFDPSSDRFSTSPHQSFLADVEAHPAYGALSDGIQDVVRPLASHIDNCNKMLLEQMKNRKWPHLHFAGLCDKMDHYTVDCLLQGHACDARIKAWLGSCIIDSMLDAHLPDTDITEAKAQLAVQYRDLQCNPEVKLFIIPSAEDLESWFAGAVEKMNKGFQLEQLLVIEAAAASKAPRAVSQPWEVIPAQGGAGPGTFRPHHANSSD